VDHKILEKTVAHFKEKNIILPTFAQLRDPGLIPEPIRKFFAGLVYGNCIPQIFSG
jgi:hypothetical protein